MRLIDADKLIDIEFSRMENYIKNAPTIDAAPVVHAHWIAECQNKRTGKAYCYKCSECGRKVFNRRQVSTADMGFYFCPNCGAKMDEEG